MVDLSDQFAAREGPCFLPRILGVSDVGVAA
jgi:hypothetical protein